MLVAMWGVLEKNKMKLTIWDHYNPQVLLRDEDILNDITLSKVTQTNLKVRKGGPSKEKTKKGEYIQTKKANRIK